MSEKRFIVETVEITDCKTDKSRIAKVITDTHELCSCEDLYELCDELNNLAEENEQLRQFINKGRRLSVKELMNNINENELLKKKIKGLEKENKQLRKTIALFEVEEDEINFLKEVVVVDE